MKLNRKYHLALIALVVLALGFGGMAYYMTAYGFSARDQPTFVEARLARTMRHLGVPRGARQRTNPTPDTPETLKAGLEHFADHCAQCHANHGSGDTEIGRNLYPKAPDMRTATTQDLSDGELFYLIENGVRLSGMPAWGSGPEGAKGSWALVRFIRHLPNLTDEERKAMEKLNPRPPAEMSMPNEDDFLKGETSEQTPAPGVHGAHKVGKGKQ